MFINPLLGDYRLLVTSPCIDSGDDSVVAGGSTDVRGKPRIMGDHVDLGAYEFHPSGFSFSDVLEVARVAGGLEKATADDACRLDLVTVGTSAGRLDPLDLVRLLRRYVGFDD